MAKKETIDLLLENTIALQKTLVSLAADLKTLNKKVSNMLELFESANLAFKEGKESKQDMSSDIEGKINMLIEQNKTLAKGLLLLEKTLRGNESTETPSASMMPSSLSRTRATKSIKKKPVQEEEEEEIKVETEGDNEYQSQPLPEFSF